MSLSTLIDFIDKDNIVDKLEEQQIADLSERVKRQYDEDKDSMTDWIEGVSESRKLMKQEFHGRTAQWEGASNYKTPLLIQSSIAFGDKASLELLRGNELVKSEIIGRDKDGNKKKMADRITEAMNYQINHEMNWKKGQSRLFYCLPNDGTVFKKVYFDPLQQKNVAAIIQYPDFVVNQATTDMETCRSFTQILDISMNDAVEKLESKLWEGDIKDIYPDGSDGDEGSNEAAGQIDSIDNTDNFLEQQCWFDVDEDGYEEPYTVTFHELTSTIVRIVPRYDEESLIVRTKSGRISNLMKATQDQFNSIIDSYGGVEGMALLDIPPPAEPDFEEFTLLRIEPLVNIVKYGFIPAPDGTYLDLGYSHLLGAYAQTINSTTNLLVDKGVLSNNGGGFTASGFRKGQKGPIKFKMGSFEPTSMSPEQLRNSIMPMPIGEPSPILFQLNQDIKAQADGFSVRIDASGQIQANTAPTTALAILNEAGQSTSALLGRQLESESEEFQILFRLNKRFFDPELYKLILDEPEADSQADFNAESLDIVPTASAEMSSKMQRLQTAEVELLQFDRVLQSGGNSMEILRGYFEAIGGTSVDKIWPPEGSQMNAADKQAQDQMLAAQKQANDIQQKQLELQQMQTEILGREQDRLDSKNQADIAKIIADIDKTIADTHKSLAEATLKGEEAETESLNNAITTYTAIQQTLINSFNTTGTLNATNPNQVPSINPTGIFQG